MPVGDRLLVKQRYEWRVGPAEEADANEYTDTKRRKDIVG